MQRRQLLTALGALGAAAHWPGARAQDYPQRPIHIIVPFSSGSGSDASARWFGEKMTPLLGQAFVVENKPGADGAIGMSLAKMAPADGYTLVQGGISPSVVNAVLRTDLGYDPLKDFKPVFGYGRNMNVLLVAPGSRHRSFAELREAGRAGGAPLNVGTFSTTLQLTMSWLASMAGISFTNIPYKGQGAVLNDLMGGQLDVALVDLGGATPLIRDGKLRPLAVTGERRSPDWPDVPTLRESGLDDYVVYSWNAFYVRREVPDAVHRRLADAVRQVMTSRETIERFYAPKGTEGVAVDAAHVEAFQREEIERYRRVAKAANMLPG